MAQGFEKGYITLHLRYVLAGVQLVYCRNRTCCSKFASQKLHKFVLLQISVWTFATCKDVQREKVLIFIFCYKKASKRKIMTVVSVLRFEKCGAIKDCYSAEYEYDKVVLKVH